ncbi:integrase catalytic domain-containing protein [Pseudoscourfieldia marina]
MTRANGSMHDILKFLAAHVDEWDSSTEDVARRDFRSQTHAKEMRGIDAWKRRFPNSTYEWPGEQNGIVARALIRSLSVRNANSTTQAARTLFILRSKAEANYLSISEQREGGGGGGHEKDRVP